MKTSKMTLCCRHGQEVDSLATYWSFVVQAGQASLRTASGYLTAHSKSDWILNGSSKKLLVDFVILSYSSKLPCGHCDYLYGL